MTAAEFYRVIVDPNAAWCEAISDWRAHFTPEAMIMLVAIGGQEAGWTHRVQANDGPAHGFWQFEQGGGVAGVLRHLDSRDMARAACLAAGVTPAAGPVWSNLALSDQLATAFARLLLWTDPEPLPISGDQDGAWAYYERLWRPGKPGPDRWPENYKAAQAAVHA